MNAPWAASDEPVPSAAASCDYNISQAAARLGVSRVTLWRWIRAGRLPVARLGHRTTRIKQADLERLLLELGPAGARTWLTRRLGASLGTDHSTTPRGDGGEMSASEHFVQFYEADAFLVDAVAAFVGAGLRAGDGSVVVGTPAHREGVDERLHADGLDVAAARASGQYVALDAAETLATFMVDGAPDPERFAAVIGGIVTRAAAGGRHVRIFGEMVALLAAEGNHAATVRLEALWNELQATRAFALFCAYPMEHLSGESHADLLGHVCGAHGRVIPAESYAALESPGERQLAVAVLQQKARWLEAEIGQRRRAEEQLRIALDAERAAREEAERALRVRNEFLAVAAHELRTPLTSLSGQAQLVLRRFERLGELEPERAVQALQAVTGQSKKLSRLISHLLDVSRLESGQLAIEPRLTDLTALVEQVVANARLWSDQHPIALHAPASLGTQVDPLRLEQVLSNLLDNAVKYSPDGGPIQVDLVQRGDTVELSVQDSGLGIPAETRAQIFDRFYQAHSADHRSGLGLGLYICRQIVELHDGAIGAEFPATGGTRFVVRLPLAVDELAAARARHDRAAPSEGLSETTASDPVLTSGATA
jgi:excisionase family DNA binding protein